MTIITGIIAGLIGLSFIIDKLSNRERDAHWEKVESRYPHTAVEDNSQEDMEQEETPDTIGLMFNTLYELECQPTKYDDGTLKVCYQGVIFQMEFGGMYARIWEPMWAEVKADAPDMPKIREAVNASNLKFGPIVVLSTPNDKGVIALHSRLDIMLYPECPENVPYVKAVLDSFFHAKEKMLIHFQQINVQLM